MIEYRIDRARHLVETGISGPVAYESLQQYLQRLRADPDFDRSFSQILDCRGADLSNLTHESLKTLAASMLSEPGRRLALIHRDDPNEGFLRLYATYVNLLGEKGLMGMFTDRQSALDWIDGRGDPAPDPRPEGDLA